MHRIIFFLILFSLAENSFAQDTLNSNIVEMKSYQLYLNKNWKELNSFGKKALDKGFDYFYLRMRMGIANYELKNYRKAQKHFRKALAFNSTDELVMEYLYYCYIFNAEYDHARKFSKKFPEALTKKLNTDKAPIVDCIMLEGGTKTTAKSGLANAYYAAFGLDHRIGKNVSFFHAATLFSQKSQQTTLHQKEYYVSANVPVHKSWLISPAFHFINRTIIYNPPPTLQPFFSMSPPPSSTANYYVGSLMIKKSISKFDIALCSTIANIDATEILNSKSNIDSTTTKPASQIQGNISLSYYPLGNNKLSFTSIGYVQQESISTDIKYAFSQSITAIPYSRIILMAGYLYNQAQRLNEMNGYIANNSSDLTTSRITFMSNFVLSAHVQLYLLYQGENKSQINSQTNKTTNYSYNNFFGGLKFIL